MWLRRRNKYHLNVKQNTVLEILRIVDPEGVEKRSRYQLKRREYKVPGPNYLWHLDGFDKLKRFGLAIHGCVDGFSRKVLWLDVATTNNKPQVVAYYYLQCLQEFKCLPCIVRTDKGTENTVIELLQQALRFDHSDKNAREKSYIKGKSTANERIERYWRQMKDHSMSFYIDLFKLMVETNTLDISNVVHIECLRFCFSRLIKHDLDVTKLEWNLHRVRKQNIGNIPSGIPNILYHWPEKIGAHDCKQEINLEDIRTLQEQFFIIPKMYSPLTEELVKMLKPDVRTPCTVQEAYDLFIEIIELIRINCTEES